MKSFYVILVACIMCLSSSVSAKGDTAPWSKMGPEDKVKYEKDFKCPEATNVMKLVLTWPQSDKSLVDEDGMYKAIHKLDDTTSAVVGYKAAEKSGKDIPVIAMVIVGDVSVLAVEFNYVKFVESQVKLGIAPEEVKTKDALKNSTGKYFCYIN